MKGKILLILSLTIDRPKRPQSRAIWTSLQNTRTDDDDETTAMQENARFTEIWFFYYYSEFSKILRFLLSYFSIVLSHIDNYIMFSGR
jgi:hypothetical protein